MRQLTVHLICLKHSTSRWWRGDYLTKQDEELVKKIWIIIKRGNDVEIRQKKDGSLNVLEVKKNTVSI